MIYYFVNKSFNTTPSTSVNLMSLQHCPIVHLYSIFPYTPPSQASY